MTPNFDLCSTIIAIQQWRLFNKRLLWAPFHSENVNGFGNSKNTLIWNVSVNNEVFSILVLWRFEGPPKHTQSLYSAMSCIWGVTYQKLNHEIYGTLSLLADEEWIEIWKQKPNSMIWDNFSWKRGESCYK